MSANSEDKSTAGAASARTGKGMKRLLGGLGGLLLLVALLVLLAPTILSTGWARKTVLKRAGAATGANVQVDSWSFRWLSGMELRGIRFDDATGGMRVTASGASTTSGILRLLKKRKNLGTIRLENPRVQILARRPPSPGAPVPQGTPDKKAPEARPAPPSERKPAKPAGLPFDVSGRIEMVDGRIELAAEGSDEKLVLENLDATVVIDGLNAPIDIDISCLQGGSGSSLSVKGALKLMDEGCFAPGAIMGKATVNVESLVLRPLFAFAQGFADVPDVQGTLSARIGIEGDSPEKVRMAGRISAVGLSLSGGPLGSDRPSLDKVELGFDVVRENALITLKNVVLDSPLARLAGSASVDTASSGTYPSAGAKANVSVDLARLAKEFPATLHLRKGLTVRGGSISVEGEITSSPEKIQGKASAGLEGLEAIQDGTVILLDAPIHVSAAGAITPKGPRMDDLQVSSAFLRATASGTPENFNLAANTDLGVLLREGSKFLDLGSLKLEGTVEAQAGVTTPAERQRELTAKVSFKGIRVDGVTAGPIVQEALTADIAGTVRLGEDGVPEAIPAAVIGIVSPALSGRAALRNVDLSAGNPLDMVREADVKVAAQLGELVALLKGAGLLRQEKLGVEGALDAQLALKPGVAGIKALSVNGTVDGLRVTGLTPAPIVEESVRLDLAVQARTDAGAIREVTDLSADLLASFLSVTAKARGIRPAEADGCGSLDGLDLGMRGQSETLIAFARAAGLLKKDLPLRGPVDLKTSLALTDSGLRLDTLKLNSVPLGLDCAGQLTGLQASKDLSLKGTLTCDFAEISRILKATGGEAIDISGKGSEPFELSLSLGGKDAAAIVRSLQATANLLVERIRMFGIEATDFRMGLVAKEGRTTLAMDTAVNGGRLTVSPVIDATGSSLVLIVPENTKMLSDVQLTEEMSAELLARFHPVFRAGRVVTGAVDMVMERCVAPLDDTLQKAMSMQGMIDVRGVVLESGGLLAVVLDAAKVDAEQVRIQDQRITFVCENGRITPSPLRIRADHFEMTMSGSVGLDKTVDYVAQVPVTRELVGDRAFKYLEGQTAKLAIRGTVDKPVVSREAFQRMIGDLVRDALKKEVGKEAEKLLQGLFKKKDGEGASTEGESEDSSPGKLLQDLFNKGGFLPKKEGTQ